MNRCAYHSLAVSCSGVALGLVQDSKTGDNKKGNAKIAWEKLQDKYAGTTKDVAIDLEKLFHECRLKDEEEDPDKWLQKLHHLRDRLKAMKIDKFWTMTM